MKKMISKYPGTCRKCGERIAVGYEIVWSPESGASHAECYGAGLPNIPKPQNLAGWNQTFSPSDMPKVEPEKLVPGVYELADGRIYVVKPTREDKTRLYAKRMVEVGEGVVRATESGERVKAIEFVYERGAIYDIRLSDRMSLERAKELITLYGCCIACNRHLKAAKSVEQGIGPVCIKNFGPVLTSVDVTTVDGREIVRAA